MSRFLAIAILLFVGVASGVLLWDGLAVGAGHGHPGAGRELRRARLQLVVGLAGFAIVLWIAFGLLTHAR